MSIVTGFYFTGWLIKKAIKTILHMPMKFHKNYMSVYQDSRPAGTFAWFIVSILIIGIAGAFALGQGDTRQECLDNFASVTLTLTAISLTYFITCVLIDQYEQFQYERERTWKTLKD